MYHCQIKAGAKGKGASATKHADYIMREGDYANHEDLEHVGYGNMPSFANTNAGEIWRLSDKYEGANRTVYRELELGFPLETKKQDRIDMVEKLMFDKFKGHAYTYALHDKDGNPHAHVMFCDRKQDGIERTAEQFFMRANKKNPEKGGCAKAEELNGKDRGNHVEKIRKSWADHHNTFYISIGSEERADHRTLAAQKESAEKLANEFASGSCDGDAELAAEFRRKAILLDRPADKRISRKEWHRLQKSGEIEQIKEERAANRELAESKAQIIDLQAEKEKRPVPQVRQSEPVNPSPVFNPKPLVTGIQPAQSEALPPLPVKSPLPKQPAFDFPLLGEAEFAAFAAFVQRMKDVAVENLAKLCQIASDMSKYTVQNEKGFLSNEKYNDLTDSQEKQVLAIVPKAEFTYTPGQPAIIINGHPIPEIAKSQFAKPQEQEQGKPAPIQGLKTGGRK